MPDGPSQHRRQPDHRLQVLPRGRGPGDAPPGRRSPPPLPEDDGGELPGKVAGCHGAGGRSRAVLEDARGQGRADLLEALLLFLSLSSSFGLRSSSSSSSSRRTLFSFFLFLFNSFRGRVGRNPDPGSKPPPLLSRLVVDGRGHVPRAHQEDSDVEGGQLDPKAVCQAAHRVLGGGVGRFRRLVDVARGAPDVDHEPAPPRNHLATQGLGDPQEAEDVGIEQARRLGDLGVEDGPFEGHPGVVDQNVAAVSVGEFQHLEGCLGDGGLVGDVQGEEGEDASSSFVATAVGGGGRGIVIVGFFCRRRRRRQKMDEALHLGDVARSRDDPDRTRSCERPGELVADAAGGTSRDEDDGESGG